MKSDSLEDRMRRLECYHSMAALPGAWMVIRVDGRSFTRLTKVFEHPFDHKFHDYMVATALALLVELGGLYAFTESDEISVLLPRDTDLFGREIEKLVSVSAGVASSIFSVKLSYPAHFDSRVWVGVSNDDVVDYFRWRQSDASRCCLNGWCYWTLRGKGKSALEATKALEGKTFSEKNELLHKHGINFNNVPAWQKRGCGIYWENFEKNGFNPKKNETSMALRRRVYVNRDLPRGPEYASLVTKLCLGLGVLRSDE
jgi:tRNA(His) 5'-end guanylyltransferase